MPWTEPELTNRPVEVSCAFCGRRSPRDSMLFRAVGWQVRYDYPLRFRCPRCRRRQEPGVAA